MKKRFLSLMLVLAMMVGVFTPLLSSAEQPGTPVGPTADTQTTANVTIHKIKVKSTDGFPRTLEEHANETKTAILGKDGKTKYDGGQINDIKGFFGGKDNENGAEELTGVKFVYWTFDSKENYEKMVAKPEAYDTVAEVKALLNKDGTKIKSGETIQNIKVPANGHKYVWAVETSKTIEKDGKQQTITGAKAVPFGLALPLFKADGSVNEDIHVYPKNTTANEPKVDKDFEGKANAEEDRREIDNDIVKDVKVGDVQNYDIETIIPAGAQYKTTAWTDQMTEGLTFNDDVKIMIGAKGSETEWNRANYTVKKDNNGFILELTEAGLNEINGKDKEIRLLVKYSATVNENAKVQRQERNDVIFHYGNDPHHGNTPYPTKPSNGGLTVTKDFPDVTGGWAKGEEVEVTLIDAHTGKEATNLPNGQTAKVTLSETKKTHTWTGLDNDRQYIVKETFKAGDEVTYVKQDDGSIKIENRKTDNPTPKDPQEPGLVTYGHRFQKIDQSTKEGLEGAKFVVINNIEGKDKGKVLAQKDKKELAADQAAYDKAEAEYKKVVKDAESDATIAEKKSVRDKAYVNVNTQWKWIAKSDDNYTGAYVFESGKNGYFKVTGLKLGDYQLIETKEPAGYAKNNTPQPFTITKDSTGETTKLKSGELEDKVGFLQIKNKKVTIPQTGGIGTIIFTAIGLAIMASAVIAIKKRQAT
ncbi:MAG: isopeptide-forming domain-containing fimbrial protein, partial [Finegoldia magna]|nr:isopeptide-forming domain-containing fimbrial protein [Finegoldia magna]